MRAVQHSSNTRVLGAPRGWDQSELPCSAIAITDTEVNGQPVIMTFWKPSEEELALLNAGGLVSLSIIGEGMPPVALLVEPTK